MGGIEKSFRLVENGDRSRIGEASRGGAVLSRVGVTEGEEGVELSGLEKNRRGVA